MVSGQIFLFIIKIRRRTNKGIKIKTINVFHYDAFTNKPNMGNPAGIVLEADGLTEEDMQRIAEKVGFNETSFVLSSEVDILACAIVHQGLKWIYVVMGQLERIQPCVK